MKRNLLKYRLFSLVVLPPFAASASHLKPENADRLLQQQAQQQQAQQQQLAARAPDLHLSVPMVKTTLLFPDEKPCFRLEQVSVTGQAALPHWVPVQRLADQAIGHCLGVKGINLLVTNIQNRLISHGWITTRVLVTEQDLSSGVLKLVVMPGKVQKVLLTEDSSKYTTLYTAMPARRGNLLDLRDMEQGLENLQRLSTVQATLEMVPGDGPGETQIVIRRQQSRFWHASAWMDNTGAKSTGKHQAGVMLALNNPTSLSDLFYIAATRDLSFSSSKDSTNYSAHYSLPFGYWQFATNVSDYKYTQTIAGFSDDIQYRGKSKSLSLQLSNVLYRDATAKMTVTYDVNLRETRNLIYDTEIENQKRRTTWWKLALNHQQYVGRATLTARVSYQHGTRWFGAMPAFEESRDRDSMDYATALAKVIQFSASASVPFMLANHVLRFDSQYLRQISHTPLTPQDQFNIGNRWTVRGFDGERTLSADRGWTVRNSLSWVIPVPDQELYLGADYGEIGGRGADFNLGTHLAGGVIGLRGAISPANLSYDFSVGMPFSKPDGFKTDPATLAFSVNWNY
ncbi:ShlB/FhaC/HecB family hemolysin secretion/activation protein [Arsenophonus sp. aPb]|uniref:ShlB/FhaC/HecB family hemolysin secretion/activation protein n=1 Tax=Arsenophonus sp. aPb TaxID=3041619 RepID=UPI0024695639|nr:ShlB/FhaC/HecB family hemolysin secretion/activation protein [Arsenophonus sp. aPb]WGL98586.1 ShlB/FhaC/HecB family hemolysin secretion/activation protein [Arsenophonus sp. aPb]